MADHRHPPLRHLHKRILLLLLLPLLGPRKLRHRHPHVQLRPPQVLQQHRQPVRGVVPARRVQEPRVEERLADVRLQRDEQRAVRVAPRQAGEEGVVLREAEPEAVDEDDGARRGVGVPFRGRTV
jgi:hypothetical protein